MKNVNSERLEKMTVPLITARHQVILDHDLNGEDLFKKFLHKKSGGTYWISDIAYLENNLETMVVYRSYRGDGLIWIRPASEFFDGRFELVND